MTAYASGAGLEPWPDDDIVDDAYEQRLSFIRKVSEEADRIRVREAARDLVAAEKAPTGPPFDADFLGAHLARPADPPMRVRDLIPSEGSTLVVAQRKTAKTTFVLNVTRCLLTGEPLLGRFHVRPLQGVVALLNYEVSGGTLARWADDHSIDHERLLLVNLRGRRNPLSSPEDRESLAALLRSHDTAALIVDPFGRAYTGKSQNDAGEVGAWLVDLDAFVRSEVGATDLILTAHAGWNGERTRGASALEDWADVVITMTRDAEDETQRFIRAIGRDIELDEDRLDFHAPTRTLRLAGVGSRKQVANDRKLAELSLFVVRAARENPGCTGRAIDGYVKAMDGAPAFRNGDIGKAAKYAQAQGLLRTEDGPRRSSLHFALDPG
jgi:hypothetical protein